MIVDSNSQIGAYTQIRRVGTINDLMARMNKSGVDKAIISQMGRDTQSDNTSVFEAAKSHPDRFVPLCHVDPTRGEQAVAELRRLVGSFGFKGIKLNPISDVFWPFEESTYKVYDEAERLGIPVLCHTGTYPFALPLQFAYAAREHPNVQFILGHSGLVESSLEAIPASRWSDNLCFETSGCGFMPILEDLLEAVGAERVLFGVNYPYQNHFVELRRIEALEMTREERELVLGGNACRIFKIE